jgi:hypothetical protein
MGTKKRRKMDSWMWFSTGYAVAVEISVFMLLKEIGGASLQVACITLFFALFSLIAMSSLQGNP